MEQILKEYLDELGFVKRKSEKTIKAYDCDILQFLRHIKEKKVDIKNVKKDILMSFFEKLKDEGVTSRSISRKISAITSFTKFLIEKKLLSQEEAFFILNLRRPKFNKILPKIASLEVILRAIEVVKSDQNLYQNKWEAKRDIALIVLLYTSGMRISEALSVTKKQFLSHNGFVLIIGKGRKERFSPIVEIVDSLIKDYLKSCPHDCEKLFISKTGVNFSCRLFQKNLENIRRASGIGDFLTPHCLRHSCATVLLENDGGIRKIQELLGHSSLKTTQGYTQVSNKKLTIDYNKIMNN